MLSELGYHKTRVKIVHKLNTLSREKRLKYCDLYKNEDFSNVIFSDEVIFKLEGKSAKVWHKDEE